jgi:hypothetical protein
MEKRSVKCRKRYTPARQIGRVKNEDWQTMKLAAEKRGMTFTSWASRVLLAAARRVLRTK